MLIVFIFIIIIVINCNNTEYFTTMPDPDNVVLKSLTTNTLKSYIYIYISSRCKSNTKFIKFSTTITK